jgi:hypothetical protein
MRATKYLTKTLVAACIFTGARALGCSHYVEDYYDPLLDPKLATSGTGGSTSNSTTGTGGMPINCIPSESQDPVADSCGVFVSSSLGVDGNEADRGTKEKPFKSITAALTKAQVTRVYACAENFSEPVTISAVVELYGALDCKKSWAYVGATTKTILKADADKVPLTLTGDATVEDFAITAADAATDGGSSIAVIADQVKASFARCALVAGTGKAGLAGTTPTDPVGPMDSNDAAIKGTDGKIACMDPSAQLGGGAKENALCPFASGGPIGGSGGQGAVPNGSNGDLQPTASAQTALGGAGQPSLDPMSLWSCAVGSGGGQSGANGAGGMPGDGATGVAALGTLGTSGYTGATGQPGGLAPPGQGGGGGGGAKGKSVPGCAGASGGGGGAGGCGGKGGLGGNAGGASIALVSLGTTLGFDKVTIKASVGGDGGNGGDGQGGGVGGDGGTGGKGDSTVPATLKACNGGAGGQGGTGGNGGGGRGGHAIGIAYTGATMPSTKGATFTKGTPGKGGFGAADMMHDGDPGVQADVQAFK